MMPHRMDALIKSGQKEGRGQVKVTHNPHSSPNPHGEPVEPRGFQHGACRPSFDKLRMRLWRKRLCRPLPPIGKKPGQASGHFGAVDRRIETAINRFDLVIA